MAVILCYVRRECDANERSSSHFATSRFVASLSSHSSLTLTITQALFNKVVKRKTPGEYEYWYVLTYLPDLQWCHLGPLVQDGVFDSKYKGSAGRPVWKLVPEGEGKEVDVSAEDCQIIKSKAVKKTVDADLEEWDIEIEAHVIKEEKKKKKPQVSYNEERSDD